MQRDTDLEATLVAKYVAMAPLLNERTRRLWAAAESAAIGYGGDAVVSSAGYRSRGWKTALQRLADDVGLCIHVSHLPPGTSKWNKVEHRLFCHITQTGAGGRSARSRPSWN